MSNPGPGEHLDVMRRLWNGLNRKSKFGFISHLKSGEWDPVEFHLTGIRFVNRIVARIEEYGEIAPDRANIVEIGFGVGRFLKPMACRFKRVGGVDISEEMMKTAREYCAGLPNIELKLTDGKSLAGIGGESYDYCYSAGVFHHITDINVILSYIREALRVLRPGGLLLFQFEGNRTELVGSGQTGAKVTARILDEGLSDAKFIIREVSIDPNDKVSNVVIVIQKPKAGESCSEEQKSFRRFKLMERQWMTGVYEDIQTKSQMHDRQAQPKMRLTFYDE